jgi:hypothetical protein
VTDLDSRNVREAFAAHRLRLDLSSRQDHGAEADR